MKFKPMNGHLVIEEVKTEEKKEVDEALAAFAGAGNVESRSDETLYVVKDAEKTNAELIGKKVVVNSVYPYKIGEETVLTCFTTSIVGVVEEGETSD